MFPSRKYLKLYEKMKDDCGKHPNKDVTKDEFFQLMVEIGLDLDEAKTQTTLALGLGSRVLINGFMVGIQCDPS